MGAKSRREQHPPAPIGETYKAEFDGVACRVPHQARGENVGERSSLRARHSLSGINEQPELMDTDLPLSALAAILFIRGHEIRAGKNRLIILGQGESAV